MIVPGTVLPASTPITYDRTDINRTRSGHYRIFLKSGRISVAVSTAAYATLDFATRASVALGVSRESMDPSTGVISFDSTPRTLTSDGTTWNYPIDNQAPTSLPSAVPAGLTQPQPA